jgi:LysR family glycine cleavage system transcriptional activator
VKVRLSTLSDRDDLDACRFDIAIAYGRPPHTRRHVEPLIYERLRPLCSPTLAASIDLRRPRDLARATLIHSVNSLTWIDYLRSVGEAGLRPNNELWLDRSTMAIEAAVSGLGIVLESEILAAEELRQGKLVAPFGDRAFSVEASSYFLVRSRSYRSGTQLGAFESWLRAVVTRDNLHREA